jgi:hypothetical protein
MRRMPDKNWKMSGNSELGRYHGCWPSFFAGGRGEGAQRSGDGQRRT